MKNTILVVDDSAVLRASVRHTLTSLGFDMEEAKDGRLGLAALNRLTYENRRPALIISDINMPGMDGITFIKEVKKTSHRFTPILVLTTESQNEKRREGKAAGAAGWLAKPFQPEQLIKVVRRFVK